MSYFVPYFCWVFLVSSWFGIVVIVECACGLAVSYLIFLAHWFNVLLDFHVIPGPKFAAGGIEDSELSVYSLSWLWSQGVLILTTTTCHLYMDKVHAQEAYILFRMQIWSMIISLISHLQKATFLVLICVVFCFCLWSFLILRCCVVHWQE
jgi:hypothetical protein